MSRPLTIFVPHSSGLLTDHRSHGDGLVAHGFIKRLADRGHTLYVAAEAVDLARPLPPNVHLRKLGGEANGGGPAFRLRYMRELRAWHNELRRQVRFDVIHQLNPVFTGMSLALAGASEPLILGPYVADWPVDPDSGISGSGALSKAATRVKTSIADMQQRRADALLVTTPKAQDRIPSAAVLQTRIHTLPHGLDTDLFSPLTDQRGMNEEDQDILFLSNLVERKGVLDLINAFALVAKDRPKARLIVAGDGPESAKVRALAEELGLSNRILFPGKQTREQSLELLRQCAIFCQPSHGEPYGMSVAEAMSCAKPLVATREGGLGYLVDDEGSLRVPMKQPLELAQALGKLLDDPARRAAMGEYNRRRAVNTMSWPRIMERLEEIYWTTMQQRSKTALA